VPPVDETVYPDTATPEVAEMVDDDSVKAGAAGFTVIANVRVAVFAALLAVIVYVLALATVVGVPEIRPVEVLKESPGVFVIAGDIA